MSRKKAIYEGKAKILYPGIDPGTIIQHFKDDATAFNNQKKGIISGKGIINNKISEFIFNRLHEMGIPNHFIRTINMREQLVREVQIIPVEVVVRNYAAGSFSKRYGIKEGTRLSRTVIEFCLKDDSLGDPPINDDFILAQEILDPYELDELRVQTYRINDFLSGLFFALGMRLIDFKIEFGRMDTGERTVILLADEISPDTCRLWDLKSGDKMDKDRFRHDLGNVEEAYREVARRLGVLPENI